MEVFREYYKNYLNKSSRATQVYEGLSSKLHSSLLDLHRIDMRIILGFFGPVEARMVLCEVSR